jgi:hypothetical protein
VSLVRVVLDEQDKAARDAMITRGPTSPGSRLLAGLPESKRPEPAFSEDLSRPTVLGIGDEGLFAVGRRPR